MGRQPECGCRAVVVAPAGWAPANAEYPPGPGWAWGECRLAGAGQHQSPGFRATDAGGAACAVAPAGQGWSAAGQSFVAAGAGAPGQSGQSGAGAESVIAAVGRAIGDGGGDRLEGARGSQSDQQARGSSA